MASKRSGLREATSAAQLAKYPPEISEYYGIVRCCPLLCGRDMHGEGLCGLFVEGKRDNKGVTNPPALKDTIGAGGFAKVKLARHKMTEEKVCHSF